MSCRGETCRGTGLLTKTPVFLAEALVSFTEALLYFTPLSLVEAPVLLVHVNLFLNIHVTLTVPVEAPLKLSFL